jgi:flagellar biosynthesis protein
MKHGSDPQKRMAVALHYDGKAAPIVTAKGRGEVATRILELAEQHSIPIDEDPNLVALLSGIPLGNEIPEALYITIAEVLAFVYTLNGKPFPGQRE